MREMSIDSSSRNSRRSAASIVSPCSRLPPGKSQYALVGLVRKSSLRSPSSSRNKSNAALSVAGPVGEDGVNRDVIDPERLSSVLVPSGSFRPDLYGRATRRGTMRRFTRGSVQVGTWGSQWDLVSRSPTSQNVDSSTGSEPCGKLNPQPIGRSVHCQSNDMYVILGRLSPHLGDCSRMPSQPRRGTICQAVGS